MRSFKQLKEMEEERKEIKLMEEWKRYCLEQKDLLSMEIKKTLENIQKTKVANEDLTRDLEEWKLKHQKKCQELQDFNVDTKIDKTQEVDSVKTDNTTELQENETKVPETKESNGTDRVRSWSRKLVAGVQGALIQLEAEQKLQKDLILQKLESEQKMEDLKKVVRAEVDARIGVEEAVKKVERELAILKKSITEK